MTIDGNISGVDSLVTANSVQNLGFLPETPETALGIESATSLTTLQAVVVVATELPARVPLSTELHLITPPLWQSRHH